MTLEINELDTSMYDELFIRGNPIDNPTDKRCLSFRLGDFGFYHVTVKETLSVQKANYRGIDIVIIYYGADNINDCSQIFLPRTSFYSLTIY